MPRARSNLEQAAGWLRRRGRELAERAEPLLTHRQTDDARRLAPLPPRRLRARTGAPGSREFAVGGLRATDELAHCLDEPLSAFAGILDFGCGSGRVLPHIAARAPAARCTGADVDAEAIAWAAAHHPGLTFVATGHQPPLPFASSSFDLVYSISVLSHLDELVADRWLAELARVLRPGGTALLSTHGAHAFEQFRAGAVRTSWAPRRAFDRRPLGAGETVFVPYERTRFNRGDLPGVGPAYGLAFHGEGYVHEHWSRHLQVQRVVPRALTGWQDVAVCRRPD